MKFFLQPLSPLPLFLSHSLVVKEFVDKILSYLSKSKVLLLSNGSSSADQIGQLLAEVSRAWRAKLDQRLKPLGLSQAKWRVLVAIGMSGPELNQSELAERLGIEQPTLVNLLNRLEKDGWIERRVLEQDRRCKQLVLKTKATQIFDQIVTIATQLKLELIEEIEPDELDVCVAVLRRIKNRAESKT